MIPTTIAGAILQVPLAYSAVEIPHLPDKESLGRALVTESGTVAGYWYHHVPPGHAGAVIAAPFVWSSGKLHSLPLGKSEYGHVHGGNDWKLVGDVDSEQGWIPAAWTPDHKLGWAKATLEVLSSKTGFARFVTQDGTIWGDSPRGIWTYMGTKLTEHPIGRFQVIGTDNKGTLYLNKQSDGGFSGDVVDTAFRLVKGKLQSLEPGESRASSLRAVNSNGSAVGAILSSDWVGGQWTEGKFSPVASATGQRFGFNGINERNELVGFIAAKVGQPAVGESWKATLWIRGIAHDLSAAVTGTKLSEAHAINSKGQILVTTGSRFKPTLYLLTPKG